MNWPPRSSTADRSIITSIGCRSLSPILTAPSRSIRKTPAPSASARIPSAPPAVSTARSPTPTRRCGSIPSDAKAFDNRGNVFNNNRQYDRAIEDYNEAIRLDPKFSQAWRDRGAAFYFKKDYAKAIENYDEAIRLDPTSARAFTNRGAAYKKLRRTDRAPGRRERGHPARHLASPNFHNNRGLSYADLRRLRPCHHRLQRSDPAQAPCELLYKPRRRLSVQEGVIRSRHSRLQTRRSNSIRNSTSPTTIVAPPTSQRETSIAPSPITNKPYGLIRATTRRQTISRPCDKARTPRNGRQTTGAY